MKVTRFLLLAGAALVLAAPLAQAESFPISTGGGENVDIDYGHGPHGNIVGGGRVVVTRVDNMSVEIAYLDGEFAQAPRRGLLPRVARDGESPDIVWVPASAVHAIGLIHAPSIPAG